MLVRVAVPVPQLDLLTYRVPPELEAPAVGARVVVPLGTRTVTGIVVDADTSAVDGPRIKAIQRALDADAFIPAEIVRLAQWTAEYYAAGTGATIISVLPPKTRGTRTDAHKIRRIAAITPAGRALASTPPGLPANKRQQRNRAHEALTTLAATPAGLATTALAALDIGSDTLRRLAGRGLIALRQERLSRDPFERHPEAPVEDDPDRRLTDAQERALTRLRALGNSGAFHVALLHGVTGSGKTEVYLQLARATQRAGRRVLMLVPEIALTPAIAAAFRGAFGDRIAIQHSGLSDGERHDQWHRIRRCEVDVVVGTRSAVFAPLADLGLVVVDEEHDASYKQEESPRYNARDVAIVRAQRGRALVVLGSATPSMESYRHALAGRYHHVTLEGRVMNRPLATVTVVDMREEYALEGPDVVLSRALNDAIRDRLQRAEQSLVLLNRRGFATSVFCRRCAGTIDCPNCSVSLVVHGEGRQRRARCHYCNLSRTVPSVCPACGGEYLEQSGFGTERVASEVARLHPSARIARLDRDAIRRQGSLVALLSRFRAGEIDVLIGTQMIAKGHDFPRVTLVGVVSADVGLGTADFRAAERTFQLLTQVAGRAGRGEQPGAAIVQTLYPEHYSIQLACRQDYPAFFEREVKFRRAMRYPPMLSLINIIVRAPSLSAALKDAGDLAASLRGSGAEVLGPAPAPLTRLRGEYRVQILIKGTGRRQMRAAVVRAVADRPKLARRITIDVDPLSVL